MDMKLFEIIAMKSEMKWFKWMKIKWEIKFKNEIIEIMEIKIEMIEIEWEMRSMAAVSDQVDEKSSCLSFFCWRH